MEEAGAFMGKKEAGGRCPGAEGKRHTIQESRARERVIKPGRREQGGGGAGRGRIKGMHKYPQWKEKAFSLPG
jgi:hypothetical protein